MISMEEARNAVDRRLAPLAAEERAVADVALCCIGTDVRGPELAEEIGLTRTEFAARVVGGDPMGATLNGLLHRIFWLGYEFGKDAER